MWSFLGLIIAIIILLPLAVAASIVLVTTLLGGFVTIAITYIWPVIVMGLVIFIVVKVIDHFF